MKIIQKLWLVSLVLRVVAVAVLGFGPWTNSGEQLQGWDVERFSEIAEQEGSPYVDFDVEYPPGSVVVIDALSGPTATPLGIVGMHRLLLALTLAADGAVALIVRAIAGNQAAKTYLVLGLPLVPMGFLRLDLIAALFAVGAFWALAKSSATAPAGTNRAPTQRLASFSADGLIIAGVFAVGVSVGAMIKIWPALVTAAALGMRQIRLAVAAIAAMAASGVAWLALTNNGLDPVDQVVSLRGATGWHVESFPGAIVALLTSTDARLELNAFRIGTLQPWVVTGGRALSLGLIGALIFLGCQASRDTASRHFPPINIGAVVTLGAVASLLLTAPLLSPQFILWLTPWAAITVVDQSTLPGKASGNVMRQWGTPVAVITGAIAILTGTTLLIFGPAGVDATAPALLLVARNCLLAALVGLCFWDLRSRRVSAADRGTLASN